MSTLARYIAGKTWKPILKKYLSRTRVYHYGGIRVQVAPGVFHPGFFFSTKFILKYLDTVDLKNKKLLELGAGSGLISLIAAKRGAKVVALDISEKVIENLRINAAKNQLKIEIVHSDLFAQLKPELFDLILINPPYYKRDPEKEEDHAWYCGRKGEYFDKLFSGMSGFISRDGEAVMVLSEYCDLEMIRNYAKEYKWSMEEFDSSKNIIETNYLFRIRKPGYE